MTNGDYSNAPWFRFSRNPTAPPAWCGSYLMVKSRTQVVGINFDTQGNLCGDVDFAEVEPVVAAITPVPGGIGTVTTSVTMAHTVAAAEAALAARTGRR